MKKLPEIWISRERKINERWKNWKKKKKVEGYRCDGNFTKWTGGKLEKLPTLVVFDMLQRTFAVFDDGNDGWLNNRASEHIRNDTTPVNNWKTNVKVSSITKLVVLPDERASLFQVRAFRAVLDVLSIGNCSKRGIFWFIPWLCLVYINRYWVLSIIFATTIHREII